MTQDQKINITTKQLASGNCQVKFFVEDESHPQYGYLLVNEPKPVGDIIAEIREKLAYRQEAARSINPFFPVAPTVEDKNFYLFSA